MKFNRILDLSCHSVSSHEIVRNGCIHFSEAGHVVTAAKRSAIGASITGPQSDHMHVNGCSASNGVGMTS